ncbi:MAG: hypothetical protein DRO99_03180, partial [Candidatus Aenigmatarchaeota archaeon]
MYDDEPRVQEESHGTPDPVIIRSRSSIGGMSLAFVAGLLLGCLAGFYILPAIINSTNDPRTASKGPAPEVTDMDALVIDPDIPDEEQLHSWLTNIRDMCKKRKEVLEPVQGRLRMMENLYNIEVNVKGRDPKSQECLRIKMRVDKLREDAAIISAEIDELVKLDEQLCWVLDEVRTSGSVISNPEVMKTIKELKRFLFMKEQQ